MHPGLQRDAGTNGGVLVSFANLAVRKQQVMRLSFPDDLPKLVPPDGLTPAQRTSFVRGHTPIGRGFTETQLPIQIDLPFQTQVGTIISPAGVPTFYWSSDASLSYLRGGSSTILTIPLRPDFPVDRALAVVGHVREAVECREASKPVSHARCSDDGAPPSPCSARASPRLES